MHWANALGRSDMKYRIEFRSSRFEGGAVVQNIGGNFHEFDALDDADAQAVLAKAREAKLRSIGFVRLEHVPDSTPVPVEWVPSAA